MDFVAGFGNKNAWNSFLDDLSTAVGTVLTWEMFSEGTYTSPPKWFFQDNLVLAQVAAMLVSWAAALFVGGPASTVFLYTSKLDILL